MSDHSDSDSSPKGSDSSSAVGDDEKKHSSDESASSDGVLVELPANPDQVLNITEFSFSFCRLNRNLVFCPFKERNCGVTL